MAFINPVTIHVLIRHATNLQLLAGMWEFRCGNTFGATAFSSYGGFWISFGLILSPSSGIDIHPRPALRVPEMPLDAPNGPHIQLLIHEVARAFREKPEGVAAEVGAVGVS
ncbi:GPR1/FUN34/yaaH family-domain-containing protein [Blyttiomyces helicus]|uniref:GPR1/FUN34/yaaH family-domain-containing protein n=1 Tax=Blyttiomyces helicus TaxID=388810 RepID=A0A4P9W6B2_9FUNG|nr:GPR1/FUN34/yaaH family-domain-containing protein [Blyttiomyces helicus]|eukprot:RKO85656.1 GPR1/FUN34/yaaH family-domain-containing protein [Blyttiomyces helicus]